MLIQHPLQLLFLLLFLHPLPPLVLLLLQLLGVHLSLLQSVPVLPLVN